MEKKDVVRGQINTVILSALYDGEKYGYEIRKEIERKTSGKFVIKEPTLYSSLKRLEARGLVDSSWGELDDTNGGRRRYYRLTERGHDLCEKNLNEWEYSRTLMDRLISDREVDLATAEPPDLSDVTDKVRRHHIRRVDRFGSVLEEDVDEEDARSSPIGLSSDVSEELEEIQNKQQRLEQRMRELEEASNVLATSRETFDSRIQEIEQGDEDEDDPAEEAEETDAETSVAVDSAPKDDEENSEEDEPERADVFPIEEEEEEDVPAPVAAEEDEDEEERFPPFLTIAEAEERNAPAESLSPPAADDVADIPSNACAEKLSPFEFSDREEEVQGDSVREKDDIAYEEEVPSREFASEEEILSPVFAPVEEVPSSAYAPVEISFDRPQTDEKQPDDETHAWSRVWNDEPIAAPRGNEESAAMSAPHENDESPAASVPGENVYSFAEAAAAREPEPAETYHSVNDYSAFRMPEPSPEEDRRVKEQIDRYLQETRERRAEEDERTYQNRLNKLLATAKSSRSADAVPKRDEKVIPFERASDTDGEPRTRVNPAEYNEDLRALSTKIQSEGFKIKAYNSEVAQESKSFLLRNRINLAAAVLSFGVFVLEVLLFYFCAEPTTKSGFLPYGILLGCGLLFPLAAFIAYKLNPGRKVRAKFNARSAILNCVLVFAYAFLVIMSLNLVFKVQFANVAEIVMKVFLPSLVAFQVVVVCLIYTALYAGKRFHA